MRDHRQRENNVGGLALLNINASAGTAETVFKSPNTGNSHSTKPVTSSSSHFALMDAHADQMMVTSLGASAEIKSCALKSAMTKRFSRRCTDQLFGDIDWFPAMNDAASLTATYT